MFKNFMKLSLYGLILTFVGHLSQSYAMDYMETQQHNDEVLRDQIMKRVDEDLKPYINDKTTREKILKRLHIDIGDQIHQRQIQQHLDDQAHQHQIQQHLDDQVHQHQIQQHLDDQAHPHLTD